MGGDRVRGHGVGGGAGKDKRGGENGNVYLDGGEEGGGIGDQRQFTQTIVHQLSFWYHECESGTTTPPLQKS